MPVIHLTERDFVPDGGVSTISHREDYVEVTLRVRAESLPSPVEGLPETIGLTLNNQYRIVRISSWTYRTTPPVSGSRYRDQFGNMQTEFLRQGEAYYEIRGIVEFPSVEESESSETSATLEEYRNPQTDRSSSGDGSSSPSVSSRSTRTIPLEAPPPNLSGRSVICKWCEEIFEYESGRVGRDYFTTGTDRAGLVTCRSCNRYVEEETTPFEREDDGPVMTSGRFTLEDEERLVRETFAGQPVADTPEPKPKKRKNLYSRKLRIRK